MNVSNDTTIYGFQCGADMDPGKIRRDPITAESRFVGIGSIPSESVAGLNLPLPEVEEIWGVLVTLPREDSASSLPRTSVALRSGIVVQAALLTDTASFGTREDVVAEAYYWELPRAWREALEGKVVT